MTTNRLWLPLVTAAAAIGFSSAVAQADGYRELPVQFDRRTHAEVRDVKLLGTSFVIENLGQRQNRSIEVLIGLTSVSSACETVESIGASNLQSSIVSALNPSDYYFQVFTRWRPNCATGSYGAPALTQFRMKFFVDQRDAVDAGKPWRAPGDFWKVGAVKSVNFDAGMMGGYNRWALYRLDMLDLGKVHLEFEKIYSYVQGQVIDSRERR